MHYHSAVTGDCCTPTPLNNIGYPGSDEVSLSVTIRFFPSNHLLLLQNLSCHQPEHQGCGYLQPDLHY